MRVLITTSTFPTASDDVRPRFVYDLAAALSPHGPVTVLAPGSPTARYEETIGPVVVKRFAYFWPHRLQALAYGDGMTKNLRASPLAWIQIPTLLAAQVRATRALVAKRKIDVVNSHWIVPQGLSTAVALGRRRRTAHVVTLHSGDAYLLSRLPGGRRIARFVLERTDRLFTVSSNVRDVLDDVLGRPSGAQLLPVGVDIERFRHDASVPVASPFPEGYLLFVGRLEPIKGVEHLLDALGQLRRHRSGLGLVIVGYGPYEAQLRDHATRLGLEDAVEFVGRKAHAEIGAYLQGCRVSVVPSIRRRDGRTEGLPAVVLETLAAGARLVASDVGGIGDLIDHGRNGWLCRQGDSRDLAEKLERALCEPEGSALAAAARATAEAYSWPTVAQRYRETFSSALDAIA